MIKVKDLLNQTNVQKENLGITSASDLNNSKARNQDIGNVKYVVDWLLKNDVFFGDCITGYLRAICEIESKGKFFKILANFHRKFTAVMSSEAENLKIDLEEFCDSFYKVIKYNPYINEDKTKEGILINEKQLTDFLQKFSLLTDFLSSQLKELELLIPLWEEQGDFFNSVCEVDSLLIKNRSFFMASFNSELGSWIKSKSNNPRFSEIAEKIKKVSEEFRELFFLKDPDTGYPMTVDVRTKMKFKFEDILTHNFDEMLALEKNLNVKCSYGIACFMDCLAGLDNKKRTPEIGFNDNFYLLRKFLLANAHITDFLEENMSTFSEIISYWNDDGLNNRELATRSFNFCGPINEDKSLKAFKDFVGNTAKYDKVISVRNMFWRVQVKETLRVINGKRKLEETADPNKNYEQEGSAVKIAKLNSSE